VKPAAQVNLPADLLYLSEDSVVGDEKILKLRSPQSSFILISISSLVRNSTPYPPL